MMAGKKLVLLGTLVLWLILFAFLTWISDCRSQQSDEENEKNCTFVCPENRGNYADPCTCRRFYICSTDGAAHRSFCPNGLYWDDEKKYYFPFTTPNNENHQGKRALTNVVLVKRSVLLFCLFAAHQGWCPSKKEYDFHSWRKLFWLPQGITWWLFMLPIDFHVEG